MSELFRAAESFICCHPALDVYTGRTDERHLGPISRLDQGLEPEWPGDGGPCSFAYLTPAYRHFEKVLEALASTPGRHLVYAPGSPERTRQRFTTPRVRIAAEPFRMRAVLERCDAIICHGGGRNVLDAIEKTIPGYDLAPAREVLRQYGNVSSPSVLFALEHYLENDPKGDHIWLTSFGAGFAAHSCAMRRRG